MKPPTSAPIGRDPDAFEAFYREHVEAVQRFVTRRVGDPHEAADLTADVFVAVIEAADDYRPDRGPAIAWVYGIARNVVAMHLRRRGRELRAVGRLGGRRVLEADALERATERLDAAREARALYARLDGLSEAERGVFELVAVDGLSLADAAAALGVQPVTARVRLHRARQAMRQRIGESASPALSSLTVPQEASS